MRDNILNIGIWLTILIFFTFLITNSYGSVESEIVVEKLRMCASNFEFLPDGRIICGEVQHGIVRIIDIENGTNIKVGKVDIYIGDGEEPKGERGLTGLVLDPDFQTNRYVYLHFSYKDGNAQYTKVVRFTLIDDQLQNMKVLIDKIPAGVLHIGGPMEFGPDDKLYITTGDATHFKEIFANRPNNYTAQDLNSLAGKILRINKDGNIPEDNPFPNSPIYTYGHRNVFGLGFHPITGQLYITENAPATDDELNILYAGKNYGWPLLLGFNKQYISKNPEHKSAAVAKENLTEFVMPLWTTGQNTRAPTNILFYTGNKYQGMFNNDLLFTSFNDRAINHVKLKPPTYDTIEDFKVYRVYRLDEVIKGDSGRLVDIEQGPDGYIYVGSLSTIRKIISITEDNIVKNETKIELEVPKAIVYNTIKLQAKALDSLDRPIPFAYINFILDDNVIATVNTDQNGNAMLLYTPLKLGNYKITARLLEDEFYKSVSIDKILTVEPEFRSQDTAILESLVDNETIVKLTISPKILDANKPMYMKIEFIDRENNSKIDQEYDLTITQNDNILYQGNNSLAFHTFIPENDNDIQISIQIDDKIINFDRKVIPEFNYYLIIMSIAFFIIIACRKRTNIIP